MSQCYTAYGLMIGIGVANLIMGQRADPLPPLANPSDLPILFGVATYTFKSQHCLAGVITPMKPKRRILLMISSALVIVLAFHLVMSYIAVFWHSSDELYDLYTLNFFIPFVKSDPIGKQVLAIFGYYIVIYPVFALSPIIPVESIIMRENLKALTRLLFKEYWLENKKLTFAVDHILLPTFVIVLPLAAAFATTEIDVLLSITGGVFGVWIQYFVSTTLLFAGKCFIMKKLKVEYKNKYKSPFSHVFFLVFIVAWTAVSAVVVLASDIIKLL